MNKLKQMLGHHSHEEGGPSHGIPEKGTTSGIAAEEKATGEGGQHFASESKTYGTEAQSNLPSGFAKDEMSSAPSGSGMAIGGSDSAYPTATSTGDATGSAQVNYPSATSTDDTYGSTSGTGTSGYAGTGTEYESTGAGLTGTALADRSVGTSGTTGYTSGSTFVEPTYKELGVDATGGPHPTFTGNRLDPGFTESIPSYHEELAHDAQHATGGAQRNLGPTGMAATTTYEDPNYSSGYTGAAPLGYESARDYTSETTEAAPAGYETAKDEYTSNTTAAAPAGYETARDYTQESAPTGTSGTTYDSSNEPRAYGQDEPNRFAEERGVTSGTGVPAHEVGIDSKTIPTGESTSGTQGISGGQGSSSSGYKSNNPNYPEDYQTKSNREQGSSSGYGRDAEAAGGAAAGGASVGALLYEHSKDTGLSESEKAAAVRRYEANREEEESKSSQQQSGYGSSSGNQQSQYESTSGNQQSGYGSSSGNQQSGYGSGEHSKDLDTAYHMGRGDLNATDSSTTASGAGGRNYGATGSDIGGGSSTAYGTEALGGAGLGAAGVGAYEYEKSSGAGATGSSSAPQGYETARDYQSGGDAYQSTGTSQNTSRFTEQTSGAGSYDPYAVNSTTGPTGFAVGYLGDSTAQTGSSAGYGTSDAYQSTGSSQPVGAVESAYDPYTAKTSDTSTGATGFAKDFKNDDSTIGNTGTSSSAVGSTGGYAEREPAVQQGTGAYEDQRADVPSNYTGTTQHANTEKRHGLSALLHRENPNKLRKEPPGGRYPGQSTE